MKRCCGAILFLLCVMLTASVAPAYYFQSTKTNLFEYNDSQADAADGSTGYTIYDGVYLDNQFSLIINSSCGATTADPVSVMLASFLNSPFYTNGPVTNFAGEYDFNITDEAGNILWMQADTGYAELAYDFSGELSLLSNTQYFFNAYLNHGAEVSLFYQDPATGEMNYLQGAYILASYTLGNSLQILTEECPEPTAAPEPSTLALAGLGLGAAFFMRRRLRNKDRIR